MKLHDSGDKAECTQSTTYDTRQALRSIKIGNEGNGGQADDYGS
ncbi:hypothetical protein [Streptomyces sp. NRRL WC-3744]|nr:hypothetical protein [Streptomyces sp. NRRL WC-3744]